MPDIVQKLGFDASDATRNLGTLTKSLNQGTAALAKFQAQSQKGGINNTTKSLKKGKQAADGFTVSFKTLARVIGTQLVVRGLAAVLGQFSEGISRARELATAVEEIQTISGRGISSGELTQDILNLSDAIGKSSQDLAEAYYQTLSNQVVEVGEALEFTSQAAQLATITVSDTKDAVNALSSVMNSYGFEASRAEHVAGTLFKTVELGRLRLSEIANVIGRVTPLTAAMGVSWEETAASIAVMTRQGVKADTAITQLRAVMTKIIRPTEEMRDIFHAWGVRDGKEAVQTFGGLNGVLSKMAEETGHSSEAMADLLRRVRTIVGQLSLMKDGGEALEETLQKITGSSTELAKQWDLFTQSDAHRLTVEINEYDNALNRAGLESLPALVASMGFLTDLIENTTIGVKAMAGSFDAAGTNAEIMKRVAIKAGEDIRAQNKKFDEEQRARFDGLAEAAGKYYVGIQLEENKLSGIRDSGISAATTVVKAQGKEIVDFYEDAAKALDDFVGGINDTIKDNTEEIAKIQRELNQDTLDAELAKWSTVYQKVGVLDKALNAQRLKARDAFGDLDLTEDSRDRALAENQILLDLADQQIALAKQGDHQSSILKAEQGRTGILMNRESILKRHSQLLAENKDQLEDANAVAQKGAIDLAALVKERNALYDSDALQSSNKERRANALALLADLNKKIGDAAANLDHQKAFLESLGVENAATIMNQAMTQALNDIDINWQNQTASLQDAFDQEVFHLNVAADPAGTQTAAANALGLRPTESEGAAGFGRTVDAASVKFIEEYNANVKDIGQLNGTIISQLATTNGLLDYAGETTTTRLANIKTESDSIERMKTAVSFVTGGWVEAGDAAGAMAQKTADGFGLALSLNDELKATAELIRNGGAATVEEIAALQEKLNLAHFQQQITQDQTKTLQAGLDTIKLANTEAQKRNNIEKALPAKENLAAVQAHVEGLEKQRAAGLDVNEATAATRENIEKAKVATDGLVTATKYAIASQKEQTTAADDTQQSTAEIGTTAASGTTIINGMAVAYDNVARSAHAAAIAASKVPSPGGAAQFHGGPMNRFFAAGGIVGRGQDKIMTALSSGETVTNSRQSAKFSSELNAINQGSQPVFREQGGPVTNVGDVNVTVNGGDTSQQTVREIGHALRRDIQRGNIKLR